MKSIIQYPGGKFYMMNDILEIFRNSGKKTIIDVFGGSGKILLNSEAKVKIYNDLNADVVDFFEEIRRKPRTGRRMYSDFFTGICFPSMGWAAVILIPQ